MLLQEVWDACSCIPVLYYEDPLFSALSQGYWVDTLWPTANVIWDNELKSEEVNPSAKSIFNPPFADSKHDIIAPLKSIECSFAH